MELFEVGILEDRGDVQNRAVVEIDGTHLLHWTTKDLANAGSGEGKIFAQNVTVGL